jgi:NAD kinase
VFSPNECVVALGQEGSAANLAKYLNGQPVLGVTPAPQAYEGILTPHAVTGLAALLWRTAAEDFDLSARTMDEASGAGAGNLLALNEIFIGHRSHQSARYDLTLGFVSEVQSSIGVILATGMGMTGSAKSIMTATFGALTVAPMPDGSPSLCASLGLASIPLAASGPG